MSQSGIPTRAHRDGLSLTGLRGVLTEGASELGRCAANAEDQIERSRLMQTRGQLLGAADVLTAVIRAEEGR